MAYCDNCAKLLRERDEVRRGAAVAGRRVAMCDKKLVEVEHQRDEACEQAVREAQLVDKLNNTLLGLNLDLDAAQERIQFLERLVSGQAVDIATRETRVRELEATLKSHA